MKGMRQIYKDGELYQLCSDSKIEEISDNSNYL